MHACENGAETQIEFCVRLDANLAFEFCRQARAEGETVAEWIERICKPTWTTSDPR